MSLYENLDTETFVSGASLNGKLYSLVQLDTSNPSAVIQATGPGEYAVGILASDPQRSKLDTSTTSGDAVVVAKLKGKVPMKCAGAITAGHFVHAAADGTITGAGGATFGDLTAGDFIIGKAMQGGVADQIITVLAQPFYAGAAV